MHLIKLWLQSPIYEMENSQVARSNKQAHRKGVISPLLANIYINLVDKLVNDTRKLFYKLGIKIVRYADDFVYYWEEAHRGSDGKATKYLSKDGTKAQ